MNDALLGVIIGGLIASITPIITVIYNHIRWKRERKLEHLKAERKRLEQRFEGVLDDFAKGMAHGSYSSKMASEIEILMPKEVSEIYEKFMADKDKTEFKGKCAYLDMAMVMKKSLKEIDEKIENLIK